MDVDDSVQDESERRKLRHGYRDLLSDASARKNEYMVGGTDLLLEDLERANELFGGVKTTYEGVLDSRFLILSADIGAQKAHQMRIDKTAFDSLEYIEKLRVTLYGSNADEAQASGTKPDWGALGKQAAKVTRRVPQISYLYGPLMTKVRSRKRKQDNTGVQSQLQRWKSSQAASVQMMEEKDVKRQENQTTKNVRKVHRILSEVGPINLFELVINPSSFSQSVENVFYVSFLIRDGRAYIDDSSGQPMIEACEPPDQDDYKAGLAKKQIIFNLEYAIWRELIEVYGIKMSVIPQRKSEIGPDGLSQISSQVPR